MPESTSTSRMGWLNWPNRVTLLRIVLLPPFVIALLNLNDWPHARLMAIAIFMLIAFSDAVDGFLARRLNQITMLGKFLDPLADKLLVTCSLILLAVDATSIHGFRLPNWVPVIAIGKDVLTVIGFLILYAVTGTYLIQPRIWGKVCTLVQLVMVGYGLLAPDLPAVMQRVWPAFWWVSSALAVFAMLDYIAVGNRFAARHSASPQGD
jgi:CDP-diacylglycerol--glycerol-3-phosphate 3-phosphatidyltransferase